MQHCRLLHWAALAASRALPPPACEPELELELELELEPVLELEPALELEQELQQELELGLHQQRPRWFAVAPHAVRQLQQQPDAPPSPLQLQPQRHQQAHHPAPPTQ